MGAVLIVGPKWCGKTTTAEQLAKSVLYMDDPSRHASNLTLANTRPDLILQGDHPRLIDEWQEAPVLWDAVRFAVDHGESGMFILTGSAVPPEADSSKEECRIRHTGTGRIARLMMRPMSLWESGESTGEVSLEDLFNGGDPTGGRARLHLEQLAEASCRGGWPTAVGLTGRRLYGPARQYCNAIFESDVSRVDRSLREPERVRLVMRSLARLQGTQSSARVILSDMQANDADELSENTIYKYISALRKIFVVEDMKAWCPSLRSKTPIRTTDTRYFVDPSIATAVLGLGAGDLIDDMSTFGLIFETLAIRDLRVYSDALGGRVYHYLDKQGLECDAVLHLDNGSYGFIEIKLGGEALIEKGASRLKDLTAKIDMGRMRPPAFRMILVVEGDMAYRREDGIIVCPISALRP